MIVELEKKEDKEEVIEKGEEIGRIWRVEVDEDLTMEERKRRVVKKARQERAKGRRGQVSNRELRVEGRRWAWDEVKRSWEKAEEKKER